MLGDGEYYTRYGFEYASNKGLYWRSDDYVSYFFVFELVDGALDGVTGEVVYHSAFDEV